MATSRTGTAAYKRARAAALTAAQARGLTHCPCALACRHHIGRVCGVTLDYLRTRTPTSAEPDHIVPHALGGQDTPDNLARVVCRRCNQARGAKPLTPHPAATTPRTTSTLVTW